MLRIKKIKTRSYQKEGLVLLYLNTMKKIIYFLACLLSSSISSAQWIGFNKAHNATCQTGPFNYTSDARFGRVFMIDKPGPYFDGYLMFGSGVLCHPDSCTNYTRVYAAKCNVYGDIMWEKRLDEDRGDFSLNWGGRTALVIENHNQQYVGLLSSFDSNLFSANDSMQYSFLSFFDDNADLQAEYTLNAPYPGPGYVYRYYNALIEDYSDSTYVLAGFYQDSLSQSEYNVTISKIDSTGQRLWELILPNLETVYSNNTLYNALDGGYWYITYSYIQPLQYVVVKVSNEGVEEARLLTGYSRSQYSGAALHEYAPGKIRIFQQVPNDQILVELGGRFLSRTAVYDAENQTFEFDSEEVVSIDSASVTGLVNQAHVMPDGTYRVVGWTPRKLAETDPMGGDGAYQIQAFINKLDSEGNPLWLRYYNLYYDPLGEGYSHGRHYPEDSKLMPDGGMVVSGYIEQQANDPNPGLWTPWLFKVDSLGCVEPGCQFVNVEELMVGQQETMKLFPNPVSTMATVVFEFQNKSTLASYFDNSELLIIDALGREVNRLPIPFIGESERVMVDFSSFAPGFYTLHWVSNNTLLDSVTAVKE
jgi:hypothetical protein